MSIALQRNNPDAVVAGGSFNHDLVGSKMTCISIYGKDNGGVSSVFGGGGGDRGEAVEDESTTSSTSSIGKNSDDECSPGDDEEVQSEYKAAGGLGNLEALEEVLPMKRSISQYYSGKSKSFTSLGDVVCSSIKDIVKPENAYTRKRKNLLAYRNIWDKNHNGIKRSNSSGILKRHSHSHSRSNLSLAATNLALTPTMARADRKNNNNSDDSNSDSNSNSNSPPRGSCLPPLPPQVKKFTCKDLSSPPLQQKFSSWRSFSLSDLQGVSAIQRTSGQDDDQ